MSFVLDTFVKVGRGEVVGATTPLHSALVHFPIAFFTTSYTLDLLTLAPPSYLKQLVALQILPSTIALPVLAHYLNLFGVVTAVPSILSGAAELLPLLISQFQGKSSEEVGKEVTKGESGAARKVQKGLLHAVTMDLVTAFSAYNWWKRKDVVGFELPRENILLTAVALPVMAWSAHLGAELVYHHLYGTGRNKKSSVAGKKAK